MPAREAEQLWRAWKERGDLAARDRLIAGHEQMVRYLAHRKVRELPAHVDVDDLVSCGMVALLRSLDRFDPGKGATFEQFAWTRVVGAIVDELRHQDWTPRTVRQHGRELDEAEQRLLARTGRYPSEQEVADELGITQDVLYERRLDQHRAQLVSLNAAVRDCDDGTMEIVDLVADDADEHAAIDDRDRLRRLVRAAGEVLTSRERQVVVAMAAGVPGQDLARRLGCSDSRVSQLRSGAIAKLRDAVAA